MRRGLRPRWAGAALALVAAALLSSPDPVLDEESWLDIARQMGWARPYDWWRPWPPWGGAREADAFVFAHPPLFSMWVRLWDRGLPLPALKVVLALPWAGLLGWSAGRLVERACRHPWPALALALGAPICLLGLQRGLMPDLMLWSLLSLALVGWLEGQERPRWLLLGGLCWGLASLTKYPALLLGPALLLAAGRPGLPTSLRFLGAGLAPWLAVESWLWASYGRPHLWEVLSRAGELPRGEAGARGLGLLVRLGLSTGGLCLLWPGQRGLAALAGLVGLAASLALAPAGSPLADRLMAAAWAASGAGLVAVAGQSLQRGGLDRLLGLVALLALGGVWLGHNFAAPRYLLPALLPLMLLVARRLEAGTEGRRLLWALALLQLLLGLALSRAERAFFGAAAEVARQLAEGRGPGLYTGEWSFRYEMEQAGWTFMTSGPAEGQPLAAPVQSSPAELPDLRPVGGAASAGQGGLRVVDAARGVGLYSETMGLLPLGWSAGPLEQGQLWTAESPITPR